MWLENQIEGLKNIYVAAESDIGPQKQICGRRVRYMALRNRYVAGEPDIWP